MESRFSEFSYGYALTEELARGKLGKLTAAPVFPSLRKEAQVGYDVKLPFRGSPLFLQFKLSDYLKRSYALEWHDFGSPYYRMHLRPEKHSRQHSLLMGLEAGSEKDTVFYAAPEFYLVPDLNRAYLNENVLERSALFSPCDIGVLPDDGHHYVVFVDWMRTAYLYSKGRRPIERFYSGESFMERQLSRLARKKSGINTAFFEKTVNTIIQTIQREEYDSDQIRLLKQQLTTRKETLSDQARFAAYLSRAYFDAQFFIVAEPSDFQ